MSLGIFSRFSAKLFLRTFSPFLTKTKNERQCAGFTWNFGFRSHFPVSNKNKNERRTLLTSTSWISFLCIPVSLTISHIFLSLFYVPHVALPRLLATMAGSLTTAAAAVAEAPATGTVEPEVPGATPAEVDAARTAVRAATTPASVATDTRSQPAHVNKTASE